VNSLKRGFIAGFFLAAVIFGTGGIYAGSLIKETTEVYNEPFYTSQLPLALTPNESKVIRFGTY
jgi:hypothetical protein